MQKFSLGSSAPPCPCRYVSDLLLACKICSSSLHLCGNSEIGNDDIIFVHNRSIFGALTVEHRVGEPRLVRISIKSAA